MISSLFTLGIFYRISDITWHSSFSFADVWTLFPILIPLLKPRNRCTKSSVSKSFQFFFTSRRFFQQSSIPLRNACDLKFICLLFTFFDTKQFFVFLKVSTLCQGSLICSKKSWFSFFGSAVKNRVLHLQNENFNCSTIKAITLNEVKNRTQKKLRAQHPNVRKTFTPKRAQHPKHKHQGGEGEALTQLHKYRHRGNSGAGGLRDVSFTEVNHLEYVWK